MTLREKIEFIADNEGCELAEAYEGLDVFFKYGCDDEKQKTILNLLQNDIDELYEEILQQIKEEEMYINNSKCPCCGK